jgi:hypothetical protein
MPGISRWLPNASLDSGKCSTCSIRQAGKHGVTRLMHPARPKSSWDQVPVAVGTFSEPRTLPAASRDVPVGGKNVSMKITLFLAAS